MQTAKIIEGMTILEKYRDKPDGWNCGAEHDVIYVYATDKPVAEPDLSRLVELGWFQTDPLDGDDEDEDFTAKRYNHESGWECFT
jgi:hypothetical protein